ncbi:MAG: hypothetical protein ACREEM_34640, partial [Blastocatellia bacterium]
PGRAIFSLSRIVRSPLAPTGALLTSFALGSTSGAATSNSTQATSDKRNLARVQTASNPDHQQKFLVAPDRDDPF